jgi:F-box protein 11
MRGTLEDRTIRGPEDGGHPGIYIARDRNPIIRRCVIRKGGIGIVVHTGGNIGTREDCEIAATRYDGMQMGDQSSLFVLRCRIRDTCTIDSLVATVRARPCAAVAIAGQSAPTLEECDIHRNQGAGVSVTENSKPVIRRCRISDHDTGMVMLDGSGGPVEDCDLTGNAWGPWKLRLPARVRTYRHWNKT